MHLLCTFSYNRPTDGTEWNFRKRLIICFIPHCNKSVVRGINKEDFLTIAFFSKNFRTVGVMSCLQGSAKEPPQWNWLLSPVFKSCSYRVWPTAYLFVQKWCPSDDLRKTNLTAPLRRQAHWFRRTLTKSANLQGHNTGTKSYEISDFRILCWSQLRLISFFRSNVKLSKVVK